MDNFLKNILIVVLTIGFALLLSDRVFNWTQRIDETPNPHLKHEAKTPDSIPAKASEDVPLSTTKPIQLN